MADTPVIGILTHDSIGVGEDGPTHEPVEQLAALRSMPNVRTWRPADANETAYAWVEMLLRTDGPSCILTTRQNLPILDGGETVMRKADLRAFVLSGETTRVWASGLTRFSRNPDSFVVNSSQGGGFKDTWVLKEKE